MARYNFEKEHKKVKDKAREIYHNLKGISLETQTLQFETFEKKDNRGLKKRAGSI